MKNTAIDCTYTEFEDWAAWTGVEVNEIYSGLRSCLMDLFEFSEIGEDLGLLLLLVLPLGGEVYVQLLVDKNDVIILLLSCPR